MIYCFFFRKSVHYFQYSRPKQAKCILCIFMKSQTVENHRSHSLERETCLFQKTLFLVLVVSSCCHKSENVVTRRISRYIIAIWGKLPRMKSIDQSLCLLWLVNTHYSSPFLQELSPIIFVERYVTFYCPIYLYISLLHFICKLF